MSLSKTVHFMAANFSPNQQHNPCDKVPLIKQHHAGRKLKSVWLNSMQHHYFLTIPPTRSAFQAWWKRMTRRVPRNPWQLTDAPVVVAIGRLTEASRMSRNEWRLVRITARSLLTFWCTVGSALFPCFTPWTYVTYWVMVRRWRSVFSSFCGNLVMWGSKRSVQAK